MIDRRKVLEGLLVSTSASAVGLSFGTPRAVAQDMTDSSHSYNDLPPPDRDQGMGTTDASGFVTYFPLQDGAQQIWAHPHMGSSSFNGLSPYPGYQMNGSGPNYQVGATGPGAQNAVFGPKSTYADALNAVVPNVSGGQGNQFFFAEGQTFTVNQLMYGIPYYSGVGSTYPVCFQSYDPTDPLNVAKHGRAGTGSQGPRPGFVLGNGNFPGNTRGDAVDYGGWVFRGLNWYSTLNGGSSYWAYCQNDMLFENMVFNNIQLILQNVNPAPGFQTSSNNIVRMCSSYGQYDSKGSHMCGIYSANVNLTIEDSIFWHCGWKATVLRNIKLAWGGPDIYKHCLYLHNGNGTTSRVHRNVLIDGSAAGLSLRGNHVCHHNVIIDCPTPEFKSGGSGTDLESPNGVSQHSYCQLVIGGADICSWLPRMQGFSSSDGTPDSYYANCLYINNPGYGNVNNFWLDVQNNVPGQISYMGFYSNRAYAFAPPEQRLLQTAGYGGDPTAIQITADSDNQIFADSPMTTAQLYAAIGFPTKGWLVNTLIANPTQNWAYQLLDAAATGFNFNFNIVMQ